MTLCAVIFLHGLGDTAYGWVNFIDALSRQRSEVFLQTKYILPTAPTRPITMVRSCSVFCIPHVIKRISLCVTQNGGIPMPAWADIYGLHKEAPEDQEGYASSIQRIIQLIKNEIKQGVPPQKILLGGFSQGAALSYLVLEVVKVPLGGVLFLSGWLPFTSIRRERYKDFNEALLRIPILHCHGTGTLRRLNVFVLKFLLLINSS